jgi:hypothetical protein
MRNIAHEWQAVASMYIGRTPELRSDFAPPVSKPGMPRPR